MDTLRINIPRNEKRIEVNDSGDYIVLPLGDQTFLPDILALIRDFRAYAIELQSTAASVSGDRLDSIVETAERNATMCRALADKVDGMFGDGACVKIFGVRVPGLEAFADFFGQLSPIVQRFSEQQRNAALEKARKYTDKYKT